MRFAQTVLATGQWSASEETATVTLPCADRHRRRIVFRDDAGADFLLDLPEARWLRDGDGLPVQDGPASGGIIRVVAAKESVADIACGDPVHLARVAWHLGNRHLPVQVLADGTLRIGHDHVIEAMVEGLGASVVRRQAPFEPEGGAYGGGGHAHAHGSHAHEGHGHGSHSHGEGHTHSHAHSHGHAH